MGQLLIIQGDAQESVANLFERALDRFAVVAGQTPSEQMRTDTLAVAHFAPRRAVTAPLARDHASGRWLAGCGTWFYRGLAQTAGQQALFQDLNQPGRTLESCLDEVEGIYVLATGGADGELEVATDRIGTMHVYAGREGSCQMISTSLLILAALTQPPWDLVSCREFLSMGNVFEQRTLFEGIEKMAPATVYGFRGGQACRRSLYWNLPAKLEGSPPGTVPRLAEELVGTMRIIAHNYSNPVLDLTGGFDSRAVAGAMLRVQGQFATVVTGEEQDEDVILSRRIATQFGWAHYRHESRLGGGAWWQLAKASLPLCDGECDALQYARVLDVHSHLAERHSISVNGSNGEICKGYWWELLFPFTGWRGHFDARRVAAQRFAFEGDAAGLLAEPPRESLVEHFAGVIERINDGLRGFSNTALMDHVYLRLRMQRWQGRIASATCRIWPCASPFLWRGPMETALAAPAAVRVRQRMTRRLIEYLHPALAELATTQGGPALPLRVGTAHRFWPLARAMAAKAAKRLSGSRPDGSTGNPVLPMWEQEEVRELLEGGRMCSGNLYRPEALRRLIQESQAPVFAAAPRFGRLLTLEMAARAVRGGLP